MGSGSDHLAVLTVIGTVDHVLQKVGCRFVQYGHNALGEDQADIFVPHHLRDVFCEKAGRIDDVTALEYPLRCVHMKPAVIIRLLYVDLNE